MLEGFEKESYMKAIFTAEILRDSLAVRKVPSSDNVGFPEYEADEAILVAYGENKSVENRNRVINRFLQQKDANLVAYYRSLEKEDLDAYIVGAKKKAGEELEATLAFQ